MIKAFKYLAVVMVSLTFFVGCTKEPGVGGNATVKGSVYVKNYNGLGTLVGEYDAQDYNVYLIYGDENDTYDDDVSTSYDGSFEFKYLQKGKYKLFVYSAYSANCTSCPAGSDSVVTVSFEVTDRKEVVELSEIIVLK